MPVRAVSLALKYLPTLIAALAVGFGVWWVLDLKSDNRSLRAENEGLAVDLAASKRAVAQVAAADAVHRAHIERMARENAALDVALTDLQNMGGRDAPLSDLLRATADRLR